MKSIINTEHETLDDLMCGYKVVQPAKKFRFSIDAVLLAHFAKIKKNDIVVDFCSGSGVIAFLMCAHSELKEVTCLEIQPFFCDMINRSIEYNGLKERVHCINDNLDNAFKVFGYESVDLVTCNPPYQKNDTGKISNDMTLNIARREVKTNLENIIISASKILKNKGRFAMVHLAERADEIFFLMNKCKLNVKRARLVQPNMHTKANLILVEGIKNAKSSVEWLPTLNVYEDSEYTKEIKEIYGL
jgi:tRNA1(Val) A37 N6-methylase TrmN6